MFACLYYVCSLCTICMILCADHSVFSTVCHRIPPKQHSESPPPLMELNSQWFVPCGFPIVEWATDPQLVRLRLHFEEAPQDPPEFLYLPDSSLRPLNGLMWHVWSYIFHSCFVRCCCVASAPVLLTLVPGHSFDARPGSVMFNASLTLLCWVFVIYPSIISLTCMLLRTKVSARYSM